MAVRTIPSNLLVRKIINSGGGDGGSGGIETPEYLVIETIQNESSYYGYDFGYVSGIEFLASDESTVLATSTVQDGDDSSTNSLVYDSSGNYKPGLSSGVPLGATEPVYYVGQSGGEYRWVHEYYGRNATLPFRVPAGLNLQDVAFIRIVSGQGRPVDTLNAYAVYSDDSARSIGTEDFTSNPVSLDTQPTIPINFDNTSSGTTYPYGVLNLEYVNDLSISIFENASKGIAAKPDGTRLYVYGLSGNKVRQFNLSDPWNLDTAISREESPVFDSETQYGNEIFFKPDGTKLYLTTQNSTIYQYSLSTPWEVDTLTYDNVMLDYSQSPIPSYSSSFSITNDGIHMYLAQDGTIYRFEMSSPWDISTSTFQESANVTARAGGVINDVSVNNSGDKLIVLDVLFEMNGFYDLYDLTTANDLNTMTYNSTYTVYNNIVQQPESMYIDSNTETEMYVLANNVVHRYSFYEQPEEIPLWHESNWNLTDWGINQAGGVWENSTTLAFTGYSGNANTTLFEYSSENGIPDSVGKSLRLTIEFEDTSGEVVYRLFNIDGTSASPDSYFYPNSGEEPLTEESSVMNNSDIKSVALFNSFGAFQPFKIIDAQLVDPFSEFPEGEGP